MLKQIKGFGRFYVNEQGRIFTIKKSKTKGEVLRPIAISTGSNGHMKVCMQDDTGKFTTRLVHTLVYEAFKGENYSVLALLDGDKSNCKLENIMSIEELVEFYNQVHMRKNNS